MDINKLKKEELLEKAKALNLDVTDKMTKKDIVALIEEAEKEKVEDSSLAPEEEIREATENEAEILRESKALTQAAADKGLTRRSRRSGRNINRFARSVRNANKTKEDNNIRDLRISADRNMKKILKGVVTDVRGPFHTEDGDVNVLALLMYGTQLVAIPGQEFLPDWNELLPGQKVGYMRERIHQPVKFIVMGKMDIDGRDVWVASRIQAMEKDKQDSWFKRLPGGEYAIKEGDIKDGVVTCVLRDSCFIELDGIERRVRDTELTHEYILDANELFTPGDIVQIKVLFVERNGNDVKTEFSVKRTVEDPMIQFVKEVKRGDHMGGEVSVVRLTDQGVRVYVNIKNRGTVMCDMGRSAKDIPNPGDLATLIVKGKSKEGDSHNWVWGEIYRVLPKIQR